MSTIRLNSTIREAIVKHLMAHRFEKQEKAQKERKAALGDLAYQTVIDALKPEEKALLVKIPPRWLRTVSSIHFSYPGGYDRVEFNHETGLPSKLIRTHQLEAEHPLTKAIVDYERSKDELKQEKRDARHAAETALGKVTTVKRLLEEWPEIRPIVDKALPESHQPKPPSLRKEDLNKQFAL